MDATYDDIINDQIGINASGSIKLVVQENHADLIGRDIPGCFKVVAAKACVDVFEDLNSLSVDLQRKRLSSFGSSRVDSDWGRIAATACILKVAIGMEEVTSAKS